MAAGNVFRSEYRQLTPEEQARIATIKMQAGQLLDELNAQVHGVAPREMALARTKLEECVMWATKAITG